jgi:GH24 family phage-related lysozyme (muramidase)
MPSITTRLQKLQKRMGVEADGLLGPVTMTRLEELVAVALDDRAQPPEFNLIVSKTGLDQLVRFEISSEANYRKNLQNPIWPGLQSGVTIGIGYDLGHTAASRIEEDWRGRIADVDLDRLLKTGGLTGKDAKKALEKVRDVVVPLEPAQEVFFRRTLTYFAAHTKRTFPGVDELPADAQSMLLSLVFNRGGSTTGTSRIEMKAVKELVPAGDLAGIAGQIRAMKRLWDAAELPGLHARRDREAELVEAADRYYEDSELVRL